jgi:PAS domain S-box-containing protein
MNTRPLRLLVIEDRDDDAAGLVREVRRGGYDPTVQRVDTLEHLEKALDQRWDVVLCDVGVPGLDAPTSIAAVHANHVDTPCIVVSVKGRGNGADAALECGAQDFVDNISRLVPAIDRELRDSEMRIKHALAESTLRATEASFRAAFELIPDGVLVYRDGVVTHSNGSAAALLGALVPDNLVGRPLLELFAQSDQAAVLARMEEIRPSSAPARLAELTMVRLDGSVVHVETTTTSVLFDGQPAVLAVLRDVSARRELVARTMHVDRMLAVGTLAAGVGHEINNPLAYVMANVAYASGEVSRVQQRLEKLVDREESASTLAAALAEVVVVLAEVDEGAGRIRDIARDLNTLARNDEDLGLVDLRAAADSALRMAAPEIRQRARVVRHYDDVPPVRASASRVSQVLLNLVINAAHAIAKGAHDSNEIAVHIRSEGADVLVEVQDTGCGIAPEHFERLFTPFFTTKPIGQGTGLGLSISKRIVRSLGGDIEVDSVPGRGTTMRVRLPAVRNARPRDVPSRPPSSARGKLLFIDDERLLGTAFQRALSHEHDVLVVETAAEALARLTAGEWFDVIFCDFNMPAMTGADLYEVIERSMPECAPRFVMVTGEGHGPRTRELRARGKTPILEKPLDMDQVRDVLAQMLTGPTPRTA